MTNRRIGSMVTSQIKSADLEKCQARSLANARKFVKDGFVFHGLRHSFNTHMREGGIPESVIMDVAGRSAREMFDRYNTIDVDGRSRAIWGIKTHVKH